MTKLVPLLLVPHLLLQPSDLQLVHEADDHDGDDHDDSEDADNCDDYRAGARGGGVGDRAGHGPRSQALRRHLVEVPERMR